MQRCLAKGKKAVLTIPVKAFRSPQLSLTWKSSKIWTLKQHLLQSLKMEELSPRRMTQEMKCTIEQRMCGTSVSQHAYVKDVFYVSAICSCFLLFLFRSANDTLSYTTKLDIRRQLDNGRHDQKIHSLRIKLSCEVLAIYRASTV